ncbi:MAG: class I SAM-dependent rRNA methyltransferase [Anaerolineae bacterium]
MDGKIVLKKGRDKPVRNRHPWLFSGAIARVDGRPQPGDLVQIVGSDGRFLAQAYFNPHSQIRARILTWDSTPITEDFWREILRRAAQMRYSLGFTAETTAYRLFYGEADGLPGLIVDRYGDYLVMQCLTAGIAARKEMLVRLLVELFSPRGIIERSDASARQQEGLETESGLVWGEAPPDEIEILENGRRFLVNLLTGHKTGFYLDQRENRAMLGQPHLVKGKSVLNAFAYTGGFAIYAASTDAGPITNIDTSANALMLAEKNIAQNGWMRPQDEYIQGNAFEVLRYYRDEGRTFDVVILDPPKFAHSQRDVKKASRGYKDLNWLALRLLNPGGLLATFSCSGRISADLFQKIVFSASVDAGRDAQIIRHLWQGPDHPILLSFPESAYLKGLLCRVM